MKPKQPTEVLGRARARLLAHEVPIVEAVQQITENGDEDPEGQEQNSSQAKAVSWKDFYYRNFVGYPPSERDQDPNRNEVL